MESLNKAMLLGDLLFLERKGRNLLKSEGLGIVVSGLEYTLFHKYRDYPKFCVNGKLTGFEYYT